MWVRVCGQESIFDLFMMEVLPVSDETVNLSHKLCLVGIKHPELKKETTCLFQARCHIRTWRRQRQLCTTLVLAIRTKTLKDAGQKCKRKHTKLLL